MQLVGCTKWPWLFVSVCLDQFDHVTLWERWSGERSEVGEGRADMRDSKIGNDGIVMATCWHSSVFLQVLTFSFPSRETEREIEKEREKDWESEREKERERGQHQHSPSHCWPPSTQSSPYSHSALSEVTSLQSCFLFKAKALWGCGGPCV